MAKLGQKQSNYTQAFMAKVIKEKIEGGRSYKYLSDKYDIPEGTINTWIYKYRKNGSQILKKQRGRPKKEKNIDYKERYEILKKFQDFLEEVDQEKK